MPLVYSLVDQRRLESANFTLYRWISDTIKYISSVEVHLLFTLLFGLPYRRRIHNRWHQPVLIKIYDTNNYIECPFSTDSNIESKLRLNYTTLTENVSECELKLEREMTRFYWPFTTVER